MSFAVPAIFEAEIDETITHDPQKRSTPLMLSHAVQEHFGYLSKEAIEWIAAKLGLQPINDYELGTFDPMFRQDPVGKYQVNVLQTSICAPGDPYELHCCFCRTPGLESHAHRPQTTQEGKIIDDVFVDQFLMVRPNGTPWMEEVNQEALGTMTRFDRLLGKFFRGYPFVKDDKAVTAADFALYHVELFGDSSGNKWIVKMNCRLPLDRTKENVNLGAQTSPSIENFLAQ